MISRQYHTKSVRKIFGYAPSISAGLILLCSAALGEQIAGPDVNAPAQPAPTSASGAPPAPADFVVKPITITRMGVQWRPMGGNVVDGEMVASGPKIDGYHVELSTDGKTFTKVADLPASASFYNFSDLKPATAYWFRVGVYNGSGVTYSPVVATSTIGEGSGLTGHYFTWSGPSNPTYPKYNRVDPYIDFDWVQLAQSDPSVDAHNFSVSWTGQIQPLYSETYTFYLSSDDGDRLWIDGKQLIDHWADHPATDETASIDLEAGKKYDIRLDYYENDNGEASVRMMWSSNSQPKQVILPCQLYPKTAIEAAESAAEASAHAKALAAKAAAKAKSSKLHSSGHRLSHKTPAGR